MKCRFDLLILLFVLLFVSSVASKAQDGKKWNKKDASEWFDKKEWLPGMQSANQPLKYDAFGRIIENERPDTNTAAPVLLQMKQLKPSESIDQVEFAAQYHARPQWWTAAFSYLQQTDLSQLKAGRYQIDGENVFATVTEGPAKLEDTTKWEAHRNYQDIHYVIRGRERVGVTPVALATIINPYDPVRDLGFYQASGKYYVADPGNFFIFFPKQAHRPNLQVDGPGIVKKIVVKVRRAPL
jgi:biofilm protein TabA